jgi:hypothetical protein
VSRRLAPLLCLALLSCGKGLDRHAGKGKKGGDPVTQQIDALGPDTWVAGTTVVIEGSGFLPALVGPTTLVLDGPKKRDVELPARFVDYDRLEVDWPGAAALGLPEGSWKVSASLRTDNAFDAATHVSAGASFTVQLDDHLVPRIDEVVSQARSLNDPFVLLGDGFLLDGTEGSVVARVSGCFDPDGPGGCSPIGDVTVPALAVSRDEVHVPLSPLITGVQPGRFEGTLSLVNQHVDGTVEASGTSVTVSGTVGTPRIDALEPTLASLGQYVDLVGAGFVGPGQGDYAGVTLLELDGTLRAPGGGPIPIELELVPAYVDGGVLRYVINEDDALGRTFDVRDVQGTFEGTARPVIEWLDDRVQGEGTFVSFSLAPVKQVVWLRFTPSFQESLRHFGLYEAREAVIQRVITVVERDYAGVNVEVRRSEPTDYALFAEVELSGTDPNGIGLLGYDNTPGKDVGNLRLYDRIGGVNALTQLDGYPGYGGVFVESLFTFSEHPNGLAPEGTPDPAFDELFDPFRPDLDGKPVTAAEVDARVQPTGSSDCPADGGRAAKVGCAVWALGSLVGTTVSHEIAHSVGLGDPYGEAFHNTGDWNDALMDGGSSRTFRERAEVYGEGPGSFCQTNYDYLRDILPSDDADPQAPRPDCY